MKYFNKKLSNIFKHKYLWKIFGTAIGVTIVIILISRIDKSSTFQALISYKLPFVCITLFTVLCTYVLDGVCQYILLDSRRIPFYTFVTRICQAQLFSIFLPGRTGDVSLLFLLRGESKAKLAKTYLFSKFITICVLILFSSPMIARLSTIHLYIMLLSTFCLFILITLIYYNFQVIREILLIFPIGGPLRNKLTQIGIVSPSLKAYVLTVVMTVIRLLISAFGNYILLHAGGISLPFMTVLPISCLVHLTSFIPIAPLGLGIVEVTVVYLYSLYGINESIGITVPIIGRFLQVICFFVFTLTLVWFPLSKSIKKK